VPPSGETSSQWDGHYDLLTCFPWDEDTHHEFDRAGGINWTAEDFRSKPKIPYEALDQFQAPIAPDQEVDCDGHLVQHESGTGRMEEGFWFRAGTPAIRVEPHWKDSQWYITAPVDLKGIQHLPQEQREDFLYSTDYHVASMDDAGKLPALAHPHHEGKSCPIS